MDDKFIRQSVVEALDWDPAVDAANIGVAVENGVAVMSGHVATYAEKVAAVAIARRIMGVTAIADELEVYRSKPHSDAEIAARAVRILDWDVAVPPDVSVHVSKGWVTLSGEFEWDYQRRAAEADVRKLGGVVGVINAITLKPRVSPVDVARRIERALQRDASLEASRVQIDVEDGKVTLKGGVRSWRERQAAERAAWSAPGVTKVEDRLFIG